MSKSIVLEDQTGKKSQKNPAQTNTRTMWGFINPAFLWKEIGLKMNGQKKWKTKRKEDKRERKKEKGTLWNDFLPYYF
jgi:hypothetical protein